MRYDRAEALFREALDADPGTAEAWFGLARAAFETGRYEPALKQINRALELRNHPRWRIFRGEIHLADGRREAANREWRSVMRDFSTNEAALAAARQQLTQTGAAAVDE